MGQQLWQQLLQQLCNCHCRKLPGWRQLAVGPDHSFHGYAVSLPADHESWRPTVHQMAGAAGKGWRGLVQMQDRQSLQPFG